MNEDDKKTFLEDFKIADIQKKMDMWFFTLEQEALWDEIMDEMSKIARIQMMKQGSKTASDPSFLFNQVSERFRMFLWDEGRIVARFEEE